MKASRGVLAALAGVAALCAQARAPNVSGLKAYSLPEYTIITHDERDARRTAPQIVSMERVLAALLKREVRATGTPTYIYIARGSLWLNYLQPGNAIVGEFVPARFANYLLFGRVADSPGLNEEIRHEYTHFFLHTQFRGGYPLWFDEGLAELMQTTRLQTGRATIGLPHESISPGWLPMDRLLRVDKSSREYLIEPSSFWVHQQSWAMVHKGLIAEPAFGAQLFAYLKARDDLQPIDAAVADSFGMNVKELGRKIETYLDKRTVSAAQFEFEPPPPVALGSGRKLGHREALESIATVMLDTGFNPTRVAEVIAAAGKLAPDAVSVRVLRMRLAARDRDDTTLNQLVTDISPGTSELPLARGAGLALFERVREERPGDPMSATLRAAWNAQAFELLDRSLLEQPDDAEAAWAFGILAARLQRSPSLAMRRLQRASELMPINADLAMAKALLCEAAGHSAEMIAHLAETARFSRSTEQRAWALQRLQSARTAAPAEPR